MPRLILNVDDREANRYVRTQILQQAGYRVIEAGTGTSAIQRLQEENPDLVLLDMNLPDINGLDVCRRIQTLDPEGKIVIIQISATSTQTRHQIAGLESGAHACLTEPVEPALLVATVRSLLGLGTAAKPAPEGKGKKLQAARAEYFQLSHEIDRFSSSVRDRNHGLQHPDGVQAIANLGKQRAAAFAKYKKALSASAGSAAEPQTAGAATTNYCLTAREMEVLKVIAEGQSTKELAHNLGITFKTAACHRNRILSKFGAHNTAEVVRRAISDGLLRV